MQKSDGLAFASTIERFADEVRFESSEWRFGNRRGDVSIVVSPTVIEMTHANIDVAMELPTGNSIHGLEHAEADFSQILSAFREQFVPRVSAGTRVVSSFLLKTERDSREFLSTSVLGFDHSKLAPLKRLVQGLGFKLICPAFEGKLPDGQERRVDWTLRLKVESWLRNSRFLFVEAEGEWGEPTEWSESFNETLTNRIAQVSGYVNQNVRDFLMQSNSDVDRGEE